MSKPLKEHYRSVIIAAKTFSGFVLRFVAQASVQLSWLHIAIIKSLNVSKRLFGFAEKQFRLVSTGRNDAGSKAASYLRYLGQLKAVTDRMAIRPKFSILLPVYRVNPKYLRHCLESVAAQVYSNWQLCIVDDCSGDPGLISIIRDFAEKYPDKVHWKIHDKNLHISATSNSCFEFATGHYIALLDHDDELTPNALGEMARHINLYSSPSILYSDEVLINPKGQAIAMPVYKPAWSPIMLRAYNVVTHFLVMERSLIERIGGFRMGLEGAQDHDLVMRAADAASDRPVHVPFVLYRWRSHSASTARSIAAKPYAAHAGERAVGEHLKRQGIEFESVLYDSRTCHYNVKYLLPNPPPSVSILIPTRDGGAVFDRCLTSLLTLTRFPDFEILVLDNGSVDEAFVLRLQALANQNSRIRIVRVDEPFNFARLNNLGALATQAEFLVLLNDDTKIIDGDWLTKMVAIAVQKGVGAVGPKLLYPNGLVQHAGIVGLPVVVAGHLGARESADSSMGNHIVNTTREVAAVTGACLMVRRSLFLKLGGMDEVYVPNAFGDVDLCFRIRREGLSCVYCADASLIHYESMSRGANIEHFERFFMARKWPKEILFDEYLNPNLKRDLYYTMEPWFPDVL